MAELKWLDAYGGQTVDELIALAGDYRIDSLIVALEEAIGRKADPSDEEKLVLAVEALEREVNNGGYAQFFDNTPEYAPVIVDALVRIGCPRTAEITQKAVELGSADDSEERDDEWNRCDKLYYEAGEDIASRLFEFVRTNRQAFQL
ncbi:conserved hypothetical protein [Candidatus Sulfopaludibacter sp. SbA3]|nr:conserved hypothetical protein [Candidatus Sulfopaludibacter sp. SbA3]